jgi:hypothetical protein
LFFCPGCEQRQALKLRYAPYPHKIFSPARIAVVTATVPAEFDLGAVFDRSGYRHARFFVPNLGARVADLLARSLADAGLQPVPIASAPAGGDLPTGVDFVIESTVEQLRCVKRFVPQTADAHANFIMSASAQVHFRLAGRGGELYSVTEFGEVSEPPGIRDSDRKAPAFTDPADALSAALAQAIARLLSAASFRAALPRSRS